MTKCRDTRGTVVQHLVDASVGTTGQRRGSGPSSPGSDFLSPGSDFFPFRIRLRCIVLFISKIDKGSIIFKEGGSGGEHVVTPFDGN